MKRILVSILVLTIGCNSDTRQNEQVSTDQNSVESCPPEWIVTGKKLKQVDVNDSTEQVFLNDTLWFELIGHSAYDKNRHKGYIKNYRTNGKLEEEGFAIYFDHPVVEYEAHGTWKFYDCNGQLHETKEFFESELVTAN
jgi:hypothetical protein